MAYVSISTWQANSDDADSDAQWAIAQEKYIPANKALGAIQTMMIDTGEGGFSVVNVYPDEATRDAAAEKLAALRAEAGEEVGATLTGMVTGEVRASSG
jgi:hypothetical protein